MQLKIDAEFQNLIPPLSDEEFRQLEENIKVEGCRDALVTWNGTIVDGHNRYKICQENGISFKKEDKEFSDREEVIEWIIRNQFGRRNLSPTQRSELALKLKPVIQKRAKENQDMTHLIGKGVQKKSMVPTNLSKPLNTRKELANIAGVSQGTLSKVENILKKGNLEQIERARKGGRGNSVDVIYKEVTGKAAPEKDKPAEPEPEKFDFNKLSRKEQRERDQELVDALKNPNRVRKLSAEALVEMIEANLSTTLKTLESMLKEHSDLVMDKENNPKIIAVLSEAGTAIEKMKGIYSYE